MAEQQLSTASFNNDTSKIRIDLAWLAASAAIKKFGIGSNPPGKLDEDAIAKMMVKNKKNLVFVARLIDQKTVKVFAVCGSDSKEIMATPLNAGKTDLWIKDMTALKNNSSLVSESDLKEFVKKHPDQTVINNLKSELTKLQSELKDLNDKVKAKNTEIEAKKKAITDAGGKV
jgi:hypothetical protein